MKVRKVAMYLTCLLFILLSAVIFTDKVNAEEVSDTPIVAINDTDQNIEVEKGESVTLKVDAYSTIGDDLTYVWAIPDAFTGIDNNESYTISNVLDRGFCTCMVSDSHYHYLMYYFEITLDTGLTADNRYYEYSVNVGDSQELVVPNYTIADWAKDGITISWKKLEEVKNEDGSSYTYYREIDGENEETYKVLNVEKTSMYIAEIRDNYGHYISIYYSININSGLSVSQSYYEYHVNIGESKTLMADDININEEFKDGLTFQWFKREKNDDYDYYSFIDCTSDADGNKYDLSDIREFECYNEIISDQFGNKVYIYYYVYIDTGLGVSESYFDYMVNYGDDKLLELPSITIADEYKDSLSYSWIQYKWDATMENWDWNSGTELEGITKSYMLSNIEESLRFEVKISDSMGYYVWVNYEIKVDTGLSVSESDFNYKVKYGEDLLLELPSITIADEYKDSLSYRWFRCTLTDDGWCLNSETELKGITKSYMLSNIEEKLRFEVKISDSVGNYVWVEYYIEIDTGLSVSESYFDYKVKYGEDLLLELPSIKIDEKYKDSLSYRWSRFNWDTTMNNWDWDSRTEMEEIIGASYMLKNIKEDIAFEVEISDGMGNHEWVDFRVNIDSGLNAEAKLSSIGVKKGGTVTMEVLASAYEGVDISYSWYKEEYDEEEGEWNDIEIENATNNVYVLDDVSDGESNYYCRVSPSYGESVRISFYVYTSERPINLKRIGEYTQIINGDGVTLSVEDLSDEESDLLNTAWFYNDEEMEGTKDSNVYSLEVNKAGVYQFSAWYEGEDGEIISNSNISFVVIDFNEALDMPEDNIYTLETDSPVIYKVDDSVIENDSLYLVARSVEGEPYDVYITIYDSDLNVIVDDINLYNYDGATQKSEIPLILDNKVKYYMVLRNLDYDSGEKFELEFISDEEVVECIHPENTRHVSYFEEATCDEGGYTGDVFCDICGECIEVGEIIPMLGHKYTNEKIISNATCGKEGIKEYKCENCGEIITESIPPTGKHQYDSGEIIKTPTTTEKGEKKYTCTVCGNESIEELSMVDSSNEENKDSKENSGSDNMNEDAQKTEDDKTANDLPDKSSEGSDQKGSNQTANDNDEEKVKQNDNNTKALSDGQIVEYKSSSYKVKGNSVIYVAPKKNTVKSVTIPDSIKINGTKYNVIEISANAFKNCKKLTKVTIGKNITKIGKNAFYGCKKLAKITIKSSKLKSVGKNAIKGIKKKAVIKVPKKQLAKYKKLFTSKTGYKKTMKIQK